MSLKYDITVVLNILSMIFLKRLLAQPELLALKKLQESQEGTRNQEFLFLPFLGFLGWCRKEGTSKVKLR